MASVACCTIKKTTLCLRPLQPVMCTLLSTVHDFCFAKIQNRYTMDVFIKPVWCHNQPCANTTYRWITHCGDRAPNRQQSALSNGFQFLASGVRVTNSLPSAVGSDWFQCTIRSSHGEIRCTMPTFGGWLKTTNGIDVSIVTSIRQGSNFQPTWFVMLLQPFWLSHVTSSAENSLRCHEYSSVRKNALKTTNLF